MFKIFTATKFLNFSSTYSFAFDDLQKIALTSLFSSLIRLWLRWYPSAESPCQNCFKNCITTNHCKIFHISMYRKYIYTYKWKCAWRGSHEYYSLQIQPIVPNFVCMSASIYCSSHSNAFVVMWLCVRMHALIH